MNGENNYLKKLQPYSNSYVNSNDGSKGKINGNGMLDYPYLSSLNGVLLVKDLTINLINISQQCDQELSVNFKHSEKIMKGTRSSENCYMWCYNYRINLKLVLSLR